MLAASRAEDHVGRYGGEEFIFILQNTSLDGAEEAAERVRSRLSDDAIQVGDTEIVVTVSMGVSCARRHDTVNSLIERADAALYAAKTAGRNCIRTESAEPLDAVQKCGCPDASPLV
jgi:diguanylate cyclase (GGDEF)-like protein